LGGVALETIRSLEPWNANYKKAMNLLVNRFDNKVLHFQAHVHAIFGLKGVEKGSSKSLRELSHCMNSHLRAIGTFMPCRAILDSASQLNFITSRLASQLNLNHRRSQTSISGIGESSMISDKTVDILVQSRDASFGAAFTAVVTHSISDYQPHFNINAT